MKPETIFNPVSLNDIDLAFKEYQLSERIWRDYENRWTKFTNKLSFNLEEIPWPPNINYLLIHIFTNAQ
jgi:hypothetical protein